MRYVKQEANRYGAPARARLRALRDGYMRDARALADWNVNKRAAEVREARKVNWLIVRALRA